MRVNVPTRVMLVDDNVIIREGLKQALEHVDDFTVIGQTGKGEEAVELAKKLLPDVILMDVLMPGKSGIEACREIKGVLPDTKILMFSAFLDHTTMSNAMAAGADGYLLKLWSRDQLLRNLRNAVHGLNC